LEILEDLVLPSTVYWNVDMDGLWTEAAKWTTSDGEHRVPGPDDDVVVDRSLPVTVTYQQNSPSVNSAMVGMHSTLRVLVPNNNGTSVLTVAHGFANLGTVPPGGASSSMAGYSPTIMTVR
jgi:hypothetical protein